MKAMKASQVGAWLFLVLIAVAAVRSLALGFREGIGWWLVAAGLAGGAFSALFCHVLNRRRVPPGGPREHETPR